MQWKASRARTIIAEELVTLVRSLARGEYPEPQTSPFGRDEHERESWARMTADRVVGSALLASERSGGPHPSPDQVALLREIARKALWHMPNSNDEPKELRDFFKIEIFVSLIWATTNYPRYDPITRRRRDYGLA